MEQAPTALTPRRNVGKRESQPVYWDIDDVQFHCRIGRSTARRLVREQGFPAPVVLGRRTLGWPRAEGIALVEERRAPTQYLTSDNPPGRTRVRVRPNQRR